MQRKPPFGVRGNRFKELEVSRALVLREGRLLTLIRKEPGEDGHFMEFPGGTARTGEKPWQTARRELREETGLKGSDVRLVSKNPFHSAVFFDPKRKRMIRTHFVLFEMSSDPDSIKLLPRVHKRFDFYSPLELPYNYFRKDSDQVISAIAHTLKWAQRRKLPDVPRAKFVSAAMVSPFGRLLLYKGKYGAHFNSEHWIMPTGMKHGNETDVEAVRRIVREWTGLTNVRVRSRALHRDKTTMREHLSLRGARIVTYPVEYEAGDLPKLNIRNHEEYDQAHLDRLHEHTMPAHHYDAAIKAYRQFWQREKRKRK
ncbi:MAG: NUDIX domain-containing protein [Candidatus Micrarchaeota archaeon]